MNEPLFLFSALTYHQFYNKRIIIAAVLILFPACRSSSCWLFVPDNATPPPPPRTHTHTHTHSLNIFRIWLEPHCFALFTVFQNIFKNPGSATIKNGSFFLLNCFKKPHILWMILMHAFIKAIYNFISIYHNFERSGYFCKIVEYYHTIYTIKS